MGGADEAGQGREQLATLVRLQTADAACWERAETVLKAQQLSERLEHLHISVTPDTACALMAAATLLAAGTDEWGGDYRDALADLAAIGLALLDP